jgi:hypothetical protein
MKDSAIDNRNHPLPWRRWHVLAWSGLAGGFVGWALQHQLGTYVISSDCANGKPPFVVSLGAIAAPLTIGGALISLRIHRGSAQQQTQRFIAMLSGFGAALFLLTVALQTVAVWIIPPCAR